MTLAYQNLLVSVSTQAAEQQLKRNELLVCVNLIIVALLIFITIT